MAFKEAPQTSAEGEATCAVKLGEKSVFGHVRVRVTPSRLQVAPRVRDDALDAATRKLLARFLPAIRNGLLSEAERGPRAGYPVIYADIAVLGGTVTNESTEAAYSMAAAGALRDAMVRTEATVVEPHMKFEVTAPEESTGHIVHDLNRRGATITDLRPIEGGNKVVAGHVPLAQMFGYANTLRSLTRGLGTFTLEPYDYQPLAGSDHAPSPGRSVR